MAKKQDTVATLDTLETDAAKKRDRKEAEVFARTTASEARHIAGVHGEKRLMTSRTTSGKQGKRTDGTRLRIRP